MLQPTKSLVTSPTTPIRLLHQNSQNCWCCPRIAYENPETGTCVYVHQEREDGH